MTVGACTQPGRVDFNGRHERRLAAGPTAALVAAASPAPVGIVELHPTGEWPGAVAFQHRLHELVLHQPGAVLRDAQLAGPLQGGEAALGLGDQVHGEEPDVERQLGIGEQRAIPRVAALGTDKAAWPAPAEQRLLALLPRSVPGHEFAQTHASLELHLVLRHRPTPLKSSDASMQAPELTS
jgi:hypothetical protein